MVKALALTFFEAQCTDKVLFLAIMPLQFSSCIPVFCSWNRVYVAYGHILSFLISGLFHGLVFC